MNWIFLTDYSQISDALIKLESFIVFKHSTRCSISRMVKDRFERNFDLTNVSVYYLDLLTYRLISDQLSIDFDIEHQSPQLLFIKKGKCIYHASHNGINMKAIKDNM